MSKRSIVLLIAIAMALGAGGVVFAASIFDITFPIPELGNCADRQACKAYCDGLNHAQACAAFAKSHGLGNAQSAQQAAAAPDTGPGGCKSATECKIYCDDSGHFDECISFAEEHGLMSKKDIQQARNAVIKGPGGCSGIEECKNYCSDPAHDVECADYARKLGQISDNEYQIVKDAKIGGPGGCKGQQECEAYCKDPGHLEECLSFAEAHGFISHDNAAAIHKAGIAGPGPGGCQGNDACRQYCQAPEHQNECIDFAQSKGFMTKADADQARKFAGKAGPGGCAGQEQCSAYCSNPDHAQDCLAEAEQQGLVPKQEIDQTRKLIAVTEQGGPGGCKGAQECQTYCQDAAHQQECFDFAKSHGLVGPRDEKNFQAGLAIRKTVEASGGPGGCKNDEECKTYCTDAAHTEECVAFASAHGGVSEDQARTMLQEFTAGKLSGANASLDTFQQSQQDSLTRFQEFKQLEQQFRGSGAPGGRNAGGTHLGLPSGGQQSNMPQQGFIGPGGCTSPSECITYCGEHKDECFGPKGESGSQQGQDAISGDQHNGSFHQNGEGNGTAPPVGAPQLRGDIVHPIKSEDLPQGFEERSTQEKQQFFKEKFQQLQGEQGTRTRGPSQKSPDQNPEQPNPNQRDGGQQNVPPDAFRGIEPTKGTPGLLPSLNGDSQRQQDSTNQRQAPGMHGSSGGAGRQFVPGRRDNNSSDSAGPRGYQQGAESGQGQGYDKAYPAQSYTPRPYGSANSEQGSQYQPHLNGQGGPREMPGQQMRPEGTYQQSPNDGAGGAYSRPMPGAMPPAGMNGGNMPPPSGGAGNQPPPSEGGGSGGGVQPPLPPPSGMMPQRGFFAELLESIFGR